MTALLWTGLPLFLLGAVMMVRGWVYTLQPEGSMALKRKKVNLKRGFTTDMKVFGRKVRRLGLMLTMVGALLLGWYRSQAIDSVTVPPEAESPTTPMPS
jgi:hypothetical protein